MPEREMKPPTTAGGVGGKGERGPGGGGARCRQHVGRGGAGADEEERDPHAGGEKIEPEGGAAEGEPADAETGEHCAEWIEWVGCLCPHVLDEDGRQD